MDSISFVGGDLHVSSPWLARPGFYEEDIIEVRMDEFADFLQPLAPRVTYVTTSRFEGDIETTFDRTWSSMGELARTIQLIANTAKEIKVDCLFNDTTFFKFTNERHGKGILSISERDDSIITVLLSYT